jgi:hypothetical protein
VSSEYAQSVPDVDNDVVPEVADDSSPERALVPDEPEEPALPGDRPVAVESPGTTVEETLAGESLDAKLARETQE